MARLIQLSNHNHAAVKKNASNVLQIMASEEESQKLLLNTSQDTIPRMIRDLSSSDVETIKSAAGTMWNMAKSEDIRIKIREENGYQPLVFALLANFDPKNIQASIPVLYKITGAIVSCSLDDESAQFMGQLDVNETLFDILQACNACKLPEATPVMENVLSALNNLAIQQINRTLIHELGGIKKLVDFLSEKSNTKEMILAEKASNVLTNLAIDDVGSNAIRELGGIEKLLALVKIQGAQTDFSEAKKKASGALWNLALNDANLKEIESQGGIKPLAEFVSQIDNELEEILVNKMKNRIQDEEELDDLVLTDSDDDDETDLSSTATSFDNDDDELFWLKDDDDLATSSSGYTNPNTFRFSLTTTPDVPLPPPVVTPRSTSTTPRKDVELTPQERAEQRRNNAIKYLHESERVYMKLLETIDELYMSSDSELIRRNLMTHEVHSNIFQDIDCLRMINKDFFIEFDRMVNDFTNTGRNLSGVKIGQLFMKRAPTFRLYKTYVNNMKRALDTLTEKEKKSTPLRSFMTETRPQLVSHVSTLRTMTSRFIADSDLMVRGTPRNMKLMDDNEPTSVQDILLKVPIERVHFYLVWLRANHTERGHMDHDQIREAEKQMSSVNEYCVKKIEELQKLEQFKEMLLHFAPLSAQKQTKHYLLKNCGFPSPSENQIELNLYLAWSKNYAKHLEKSNKKWNALKGDLADPKLHKDLKKLVKKYGIPPAHRPRAWMKISGASKLMAENTGYYKRILGVHSNQANASWFSQIEKDLKRTYTNHPLFIEQDNEEVTMAMRRILIAYSWRNPIVAYCQSFNYIVGMLLLHLSEEETFWLFVTLVENYLPQNFYSPNLKGVLVDATVLDELIFQNLYKLSARLKKLEFDISSFTMSFFMKLFTTDFPVEVTLRTWDAMFTFGPVMLFRVTLALLKLNEAQLLKTESLSECLLLFQNQIVKQCFDVKKLLKTAFGYSKVTPDKIDTLRKKYTPLIEIELQKQEEKKEESEVQKGWN
jgi:hypothetical protein